jgi:hypothetical protein
MNNQPPAPYERFAYAVVMDGGWYVGIWKELETAELVAGKHPKGTVVPMTKFASGVESEKGDTTAPIGDHPRTDALGLPCTRSDQYGEVVPAKAFWGMLQHARTLERELAEAKDDLEDSRAACRLTYGLKESFKERADTAEAALAAAHTRLEANFYFDNGGDRIDCEPGEIPDGIACRDETIKGQDKIIAELRAALAAAARDEREACAVICDGIGAETAATMIRAGRVS